MYINNYLILKLSIKRKVITIDCTIILISKTTSNDIIIEVSCQPSKTKELNRIRDISMNDIRKNRENIMLKNLKRFKDIL